MRLLKPLKCLLSVAVVQVEKVVVEQVHLDFLIPFQSLQVTTL